MTDISVIKMIISVAVWRIYPSCVNDKLRAWEGLGHSRMFCARLSRDDFRSKLEIISFLSRVMSVSKSFLFPALLKDLAPNFQALGLLVFDDVLEVFLKTPLRHRAFFLQTPTTWTTTTSIFFENFLSFFQNRADVTCRLLWRSPSWAKHFGDGTSKTKMITWLPCVGETERRRTMDRRRDWHESYAAIHGPKEKRKKTRKSACDCAKAQPSSSTNQRVLRSLFPRPDVATVSHFVVFVDVDVQLQDGEAAARGKRRKAVIRDISGIDHWGVTNLSAPISFAGQGHCTVFRHVMQLLVLALCWKSTSAVILSEIKKKKSLSNFGHRGTKAENLASHSTG